MQTRLIQKLIYVTHTLSLIFPLLPQLLSLLALLSNSNCMGHLAIFSCWGRCFFDTVDLVFSKAYDIWTPLCTLCTVVKNVSFSTYGQLQNLAGIRNLLLKCTRLLIILTTGLLNTKKNWWIKCFLSNEGLSFLLAEPVILNRCAAAN